MAGGQVWNHKKEGDEASDLKGAYFGSWIMFNKLDSKRDEILF